MPAPFPGMNPYLEDPDLWSEVHNRLIVAIADTIAPPIRPKYAPPIRPKYHVAIEKRTYLSSAEDNILVGISDVSVLSKYSSLEQTPLESSPTATLPPPNQPLTVTVPLEIEVNESYLEIRETKTGAVVTTIEILSPKNKRAGVGREAYLRKRQQVLASHTHLIEIDLLRGGVPMPLEGTQAQRASQTGRIAPVVCSFPGFAFSVTAKRVGWRKPSLPGAGNDCYCRGRLRHGESALCLQRLRESRCHLKNYRLRSGARTSRCSRFARSRCI